MTHRGDAAGRAQPAVHPGEHRPRRSVPRHPGGRHRPRPERRGHPRPARGPRRRRLHARRLPTTRRSATAATTTGRAAPITRSRRSTRTTGSPARWSPAPRSRTAGTSTDVDLVQTATLPDHERRDHHQPRLRRGPPGAEPTASAALSQPWTTTRDAYDAGWHDYLSTLKPVPASAQGIQRQYLASALVLAAGEDKAHPGAFIASPSVPWLWGDEVKDLSDPSSSYHEVWARDLYQIGTGSTPTATRPRPGGR